MARAGARIDTNNESQAELATIGTTATAAGIDTNREAMFATNSKAELAIAIGGVAGDGAYLL